MTQLIRYRPALPFSNSFDGLFNDAFFRPMLCGNSDGDSCRGLAVDVKESPDEYVLSASLPGVDASDVSIEIEDGAVAIRAENREEEGDAFLVRERSVGHYYRKLSLPSPLDAKKATAEMQHGLLSLSLPKAETAKSQLVPVKAI